MNAQLAPVVSPTEQSHGELDKAYAHFNERLFDNELPPCMIRMQSTRATRSLFDPNRFVTRELQIAHCIDINPQIFASSTVKQVLGVLVSEMAQVWAHKHNSRGRRGYHSTGWADRMEKLGLMPSDTGKQGGKRTGERVLHYVIAGGPFEIAADDLIATGFTITWLDRIYTPRVEGEEGDTPPEEILGAPLLGKSALLVSAVPEPGELQDPNTASTKDEVAHHSAQSSTEPTDPSRAIDPAYHQFDPSRRDEVVTHESRHEDASEDAQGQAEPITPVVEAPMADLVLESGSKKATQNVSEPLIKPVGMVALNGKKPRTDKVKFTCPTCELNAWAKKSAKFRCDTCDQPMKSELGDDETGTATTGENKESSELEHEHHG